MKKILLIFSLVFGLGAVMGCGDDGTTDIPEEPVIEPDPGHGPDYDALRDSVGTATRPTDWTPVNAALLDPTAVDRIVVTSAEVPVPVDLRDDLMAAFVGGECRDVASPVVEANGKVAFTLTVMPRTEGESATPRIELRYYAKSRSRIYVATPFAFDPATTHHGNLTTQGFQPEWK